MIILGIDGGITGAVAVFRNDNLQGVFDIPAIEKPGKNKVKREIDARRLASMIYSQIKDDDAIVAYCELVRANPTLGLSNMFSMGDSFGAIRGILGAMNIQFYRVHPQRWQQHFGIYGKKAEGEKKERSLKKARELFPHQELHLKKHHNRADALLIGEYGRYAEEGKCAS